MSTPLTEKPAVEPLPRTAGAASMIDGHYAPPPKDKDGKMWVRTSAIIQADPQTLYERWSDLESSPSWQEEITSVKKTGPKTSHWTMKSGDKTIEWDAETLASEPGKRIAWHSTAGDIHEAGEVVFEPAPAGRGTIVTILMMFEMGKIAAMWETFVGRNPKQAVVENLRHFKALVEANEIPRVYPVPHGPRGTIGSLKESAFGEKLPIPAGSNASQPA